MTAASDLGRAIAAIGCSICVGAGFGYSEAVTDDPCSIGASALSFSESIFSRRPPMLMGWYASLAGSIGYSIIYSCGYVGAFDMPGWSSPPVYYCGRIGCGGASCMEP